MFKYGKLFIIIFSLAIAIRLIYLLITPPKQLPDEVFIFERSWYMSIGNHNHPTHYSNSEYYYPPLYFFISSLIIKTLTIISPEPLSVNEAYLRFYFPLRTFSFFLSISSLFLIWKTIEKIKIENPLKISAFTFIALLPSFASFSISPNHNVLLFFFLSLILFLTTKNDFRFNSYKHATLCGLISGLASLTKFDAFIIIPSMLFLIITSKTKAAVSYMKIFIFSAIVVGGWWYLLNLIKFGWFYDKNLFEAAISGFDKPFTVFGYELYVAVATLRTFLATFGVYNQLYLHPSAYSAFILFLFFSIYGLIKNQVFKSLLKSGKLYLFLLIMFLANLAVFLQFNFIYTYQAQGRFFFPSILFIGLTLSLGFSSLFKPKYYIPTAIFIVSGMILNLWGYLCILNSFYNLNLPNINLCENILTK